MVFVVFFAGWVTLGFSVWILGVRFLGQLGAGGFEMGLCSGGNAGLI